MTDFQVQIVGEPEPQWEGVSATQATVHASGALVFEKRLGKPEGYRLAHVITYGPHGWLAYFEEN